MERWNTKVFPKPGTMYTMWRPVITAVSRRFMGPQVLHRKVPPVDTVISEVFTKTIGGSVWVMQMSYSLH